MSEKLTKEKLEEINRALVDDLNQYKDEVLRLTIEVDHFKEVCQYYHGQIESLEQTICRRILRFIKRLISRKFRRQSK